MHLIEGSYDWIIEDLDNERSYIFERDVHQVMTAKWPETPEQEKPHFIAIATGKEAAARVWDHLQSMVVSKSKQATEPAPVETPRFKAGDTVWHYEHDLGEAVCGVVTNETPLAEGQLMVLWQDRKWSTSEPLEFIFTSAETAIAAR